ncbi:hypothetical protein K402DRAFT_388635 [Aulographum hederae CBS 113979]|uniref:FAS1 domain-containing protein n=1 Tax=Aulographum hederae CBS 113979 TaxID=1176131 RepID=A0A6G1HG73_9PEZI|nr:hypothetical protein K402DRAFT_388635 [Aulographum hederae CBS 113979]
MPSPGSSITLSDVIGTERLISIFSGFTRDIDTVSQRLESSSLNTTVLAPSDTAIRELPRKPWEDPRDYAALGTNAYGGEDGEDRAHKNLRRFVEAHVVPESPWGKETKVQTVAGNTVWWEEKEGKRWVMPGSIEVETVAKSVGNGEVWIMKGVNNYA